jgi:hypothetical protein
LVELLRAGSKHTTYDYKKNTKAEKQYDDLHKTVLQSFSSLQSCEAGSIGTAFVRASLLLSPGVATFCSRRTSQTHSQQKHLQGHSFAEAYTCHEAYT